MTNTDNLFLVYVNPIGENANGDNEYEFFFSETPDTVYAEDWNIECPSACANIQPDESMYSLIERVETGIPLFCAQENSCFSYSDVQDGILALCFENISGYENYPEPYRIILHYGEAYDDVVEHLKGRGVVFREKNTDENTGLEENNENNEDF